MSKKGIKNILGWVVELVVSLGVSLAFFGLFLMLLKVVFPTGTSMTDLFSDSAQQRELQDDLLPEEQEKGTVNFTAVLKSFHNTVKSKPASAISWTNARAGMSLYNRDAVQTLSSAKAEISFSDKNNIELGGNSLVIIKSLEQIRETGKRKSVLVLMSGEARGVLGGGRDAVAVEMSTPSALTRVQKKGSAEFLVTVNPDRSSTITVLRGVAEVSAQGKMVRVGENSSTNVQMSQAPEEPRPLAAPPQLSAPAKAARIPFRELSPRVAFSWQPLPAIGKYRLMVARDAAFHQVVLDERVSGTSFTSGTLNKGDYYWRVSGLDGWSEGRTSEARALRLVADREPPLLQVEFPTDIVTESQYLLKGKTEEGARVFVNGTPLGAAGQGEFSRLLQLQRGINIITVEAVDEAGNIAYRSGRVNGKF